MNGLKLDPMPIEPKIVNSAASGHAMNPAWRGHFNGGSSPPSDEPELETGLSGLILADRKSTVKG